MNYKDENKLIAEFMGATLHKNGGYQHYSMPKYVKPELMEYHDSWDWIMPVIEKIEDIGFEVVIGRISCNVNEILGRDKPIVSMVCGNISKKLYLIFTTVVKFIKWYNTQK